MAGYRETNQWCAVEGLRSAAVVLWLDGVSTNQIAVLLNQQFSGKLIRRLSKNSVVGWAHRNQMPSRPSPIRIAAPKQKPLRLEGASCRTKPSITPITSPVEPIVLARPPPQSQPHVTVFHSRQVDDSRGCCYPFGDPRTSAYHSCGEPRASCSSPYCRTHSGLCYTRYSGN